jgi:hypothetical protein
MPRLGLLNGLLIGLALGLGLWLPDVLLPAAAKTRLLWPTVALGLASAVLIAGAAGWLGARAERGWVNVAAWLAAAVLLVLLLGHLPFEGRSLLVWLLDNRFWGRSIYVFDPPAQVRMAAGGFFVALAAIVLGLVQPYRLEGIRGALNRGRLTARAAVLLALPLPVAAAAGLAAGNIAAGPLRGAPQLAWQGIEVAREYAGDLVAYGRQEGFNYGALRGVREQLTREYTLMLGEIDLDVSQTLYVAADFDNGAWIYCRVLVGQLSFCYDASPPYTRGLAGVLSGKGTPDCAPCTVTLEAATRAWLLEQGAALGPMPRITRLAQWGSHVLMRADGAGGGAIECFFEGIAPVTISECRAAGAGG